MRFEIGVGRSGNIKGLNMRNRLIVIVLLVKLP